MGRKMDLDLMIRLSIEDSERWRGGLGNGGAEEGHQGPTTPGSGHRRVDQAGALKGKDCSRSTRPLCRVIGFIPHLQGKVVDWFPSRKKILPLCEHHSLEIVPRCRQT